MAVANVTSLTLIAILSSGLLYFCGKAYEARAAFYHSKVKKKLVSTAAPIRT
jgi:hypothetical protein